VEVEAVGFVCLPLYRQSSRRFGLVRKLVDSHRYPVRPYLAHCLVYRQTYSDFWGLVFS
jgi:hypothetical protein